MYFWRCKANKLCEANLVNFVKLSELQVSFEQLSNRQQLVFSH